MRLLVVLLLCCAIASGSLNTRRRSWTSYLHEIEARNHVEPQYRKHPRCTPSHIIALSAISVGCAPRPTVVKLSDPKDVQVLSMNPRFVEVMRCNGRDHRSHPAHVCLPVTKRTTWIPVLLATGRNECGDIAVEEHVNCSMGCRILPSDCGPNHIYSPERCACECRNQSEAYPCEQRGKTWDHLLCQCVKPYWSLSM